LIANYAWENLKFLKKDDSHGNRAMGREEVGLVCADLMQITFDSRKYQFIGKVRVIPPVTRLFYPESGHPFVNLFDFSIEVGLCAVTLLQSWFISLVAIGEMPTLSQPIMQGNGGILVDSCEVIASMWSVSTRHGGVEPRDVVIRCLKHGALSSLERAGVFAVDMGEPSGCLLVLNTSATSLPTRETRSPEGPPTVVFSTRPTIGPPKITVGLAPTTSYTTTHSPNSSLT
jgi:hypothetical protein